MIGLGGVRDGSGGGDEMRGRQAKSRSKLSYILLQARDGRLLKRLTSGPKIVFPAVDFVTIPIQLDEDQLIVTVSMRTPPDDSAPRPPLSPVEKAAFQAFKEERESGSRLIRKGEAGSPKKRFRKATSAKPKPRSSSRHSRSPRAD
jgi:hypothetical protein